MDNVEQAVMKYIIRDFDSTLFEENRRKCQEQQLRSTLIYGEGTAEVKLEESYRNMREKIEPRACS